MASVSPWKTLFRLYRQFSVQVDVPPFRGVSKDDMHVSQFDYVLHHVKGRSNVAADALSCPAVSEEHSTEPDVPTYHVPDMSYVYIPLDVSRLLLDDVKLRGESRPLGVAQEQIHNAEFHLVRAHLSKEVRKAIQQGYSKDKVFKNIWKTKQSNKNFIIDKESYI
uniref:AlNc14C44G3613 protein n=1 Tax=Albugo laibachii Nc14 TaxID=890382 RepID=F0WA83_9STRA|nr:AlNc14C44G3613 [Albugo laibachii Nc14]|eukprot:CCA18053.1 AlNc14C44G3613 [Albugo laibachii Nc14]